MRTFANEPASRFFSRLTIRTKTFIAAAVVLICLIGMGVIAVLGSREISRNLDELSSSNLPSRSAAVTVNNSVVAAHMRIFRYVSWASNGVNEKLLQTLRDEIETDFSSVRTSFNELAARQDLSAEIKAQLSALDQKLQKYEGTARDVLDVGRTDPPMATMMLGQTDDSFTEIEGNIRKILNAIMAGSYSIVGALSFATSREMLSLGIGLISCFLVSVAAMAFVARSIVKPITSITNAMQRLATGDTTVAPGLRGARRRNRTDDRGNRDFPAQRSRNSGHAARSPRSGGAADAETARGNGRTGRGVRGIGQADRRSARRSGYRGS
jgi:methyl-accepting chemotaxis protein